MPKLFLGLPGDLPVHATGQEQRRAAVKQSKNQLNCEAQDCRRQCAVVAASGGQSEHWVLMLELNSFRGWTSLKLPHDGLEREFKYIN
jgi:hypothetical protein